MTRQQIIKPSVFELGDSPVTATMLVAEWVGPVSVVARYKVWVCGRSLAGIVGSNPAGWMDVFVLRVFYIVR
jgi:hypothetical protein